MKKHNEGYTLVLVMVVLIVLSLLSTLILSASLRNLESQQNSVERMQDRYTARGQLEKMIQTMKNSTEPLHFGEDAVKGEADNILKVTVATTAGTTKITCQLQLTGNISKIAGGGYSIQNISDVKYLSYEISSVEEGAGA